MDSSEIAKRTDTGNIGFFEFLPGVFRFLKIAPKVIGAVKAMKKLKPGDCGSLGYSFTVAECWSP